jgi:hypothetical protein
MYEFDFEAARSVVTIIKEGVTTFGVVFGGIWAYRRFGTRREGHPKIEFTLDAKALGVVDDKMLVEVSAILENKGLVRHEISDFTFSLYTLPSKGEIRTDDAKLQGQVRFNKEEWNCPDEGPKTKRSWISERFGSTFVDPGVTQRYTYIASVPSDTAFVLLRSEFKYPDAVSDFHSAQNAFSVRQPPAQGAKAIESTGVPA